MYNLFFFLDHGLEVLLELIPKTNFPWLMSNVIDNETGEPLGNGKRSHIISHDGIKIGLIGLVEREWLDTLSTIDSNEVTYSDFIEVGHELSTQLRKDGCDIVIALTHMRNPNDIKLAEQSSGIDLILGGHDHVCEGTIVNGIHIIKSGTDFRQFGLITIETERKIDGKLNITFDPVNVTSDYEENKSLKEIINQYTQTIEERMDENLGNFSVDLDGRFEKMRTSETNLGNWVCDVVLSATGADVVILNSGTFRSDRIHSAGPFKMRDLVSIIPMHDPLVVIEVTGKTILAALENGVSAYPRLEGRFPQISGISFAFDPKAEPFKRVFTDLVQIADEWLDENQNYSLCTTLYLYRGRDGFTMLKDANVIVSISFYSENQSALIKVNCFHFSVE